MGQAAFCPCQHDKFTCPAHCIYKPSVSVAKVPACAVQGDFSTQLTMTVQLSGRACTAKHGHQASSLLGRSGLSAGSMDAPFWRPAGLELWRLLCVYVPPASAALQAMPKDVGTFTNQVHSNR